MVVLLMSDNWDILIFLYTTTNTQNEMVEKQSGFKLFNISHPLGEVIDSQIILRVVYGERNIFDLCLNLNYQFGYY